jgi:hypothetical protein
MFPLDVPHQAAWQHRTARVGFETVFIHAPASGGWQLDGCTTAVEDGEPFAISYTIEVDERWRTRRAYVRGRSSSGEHERRLESDGEGRWWVDGAPATHLDGCPDVDLESSACTNTFPVHRLALGVGSSADAAAAWVRAADLRVERLEQHYTRIDDHGGRPCFDYVAPSEDFASRLVFDRAGLVLDYPGIANRVL